MVFDAGIRIDRIKNDMRMDMSFIDVCSDYGFISLQMLGCKPFRNFMRQFRRNLIRLKRLDNMVALASICFVKSPFCIHHLLICKTGIAVEMIDENTLIGLIRIRNVLNGLRKSTIAV